MRFRPTSCLFSNIENHKTLSRKGGTWPHIKLNIESKIRADIAMHPVVPLEPLKRYSGCWETLLA